MKTLIIASTLLAASMTMGSAIAAPAANTSVPADVTTANAAETIKNSTNLAYWCRWGRCGYGWGYRGYWRGPYWGGYRGWYGRGYGRCRTVCGPYRCWRRCW